MRTFLLLLALGAMTFSGCVVAVGHRHHRHGFYYRGHYSRHHWNHAGEAYVEAIKIRDLTVLPVALPEDIDGKYPEDAEKQWRVDWPMQCAKTMANTVTMAGDIHVTATAAQTAPLDGYTLSMEITDLDLGDREKAATGPEPEGWSKLTATAVIKNARTGEEVVELTFEVSTARYTDNPPIDALTQQAGQSLVDWFREKKAEAETANG
jgi:hypothetical protein